VSVESITYNAEKIGGTSPTHDTEILTMFYSNFSQDDAELTVRFAVKITPSSTPATDWSALATACNAIEQALRQRYAKLTVDWGSTNQETWDPATSGTTTGTMGFDQEPYLRKLSPEEFPNSNAARGYEFRVRISLPPNYTDAFGAAAGRRQVDVGFHYDTDQRLVVQLTGSWTQVPSALARAQFLSAIDGASGYAAYRLAKINSTVPQASGATWAVTNREESDPNSLSTLTFSRTYQQHINGRRISTLDIRYGDAGQRTVLVHGTYLRTVDGSGGAYGNVYGSAAGSLANYGNATTGGVKYATGTQLPGLAASQGGALTTGHNAKLLQNPVVDTNEQDDRTDYTLVFQEFFSSVRVDLLESGQRLVTIQGTYFRSLSATPAAGVIWGNTYGATAQGSLANYADGTNGGLAWAVTQLAALSAAQGGALTPGQDCELLKEPLLATDDQDFRTEYQLIYRELIQKQSTANGSYLDDPNIIGDSIQFASVFAETNDSPTPTAAASQPGPDGSVQKPAGANSGSGQTGPRPVSPDQATGQNQGTGSGAGGTTPAVKPIDVFVTYRCYLKKTISQPAVYWNVFIFPLLVSTLGDAFPSGIQAIDEYVGQKFTVDNTSNQISADLHFRAYQANVILFSFALGIFNEHGIRVDAAFTGNPHEYLVQQALPRSTMSRKVEAVYVTGSYSLDQFKTPQTLEGWVVLMDAKPSTVDKVLGIPSLGVPQKSLTYASLEENLIWVAKNVGQAVGSKRNITYTPQGTGGGGSTNTPPAQQIVDTTQIYQGAGVDAFGHGI